ncbi:MAG TPA: oligosaccharide flippase family protein, partial [Acidimicrobiales bacterium]|nr:oligosaccharide flippase family protein [Acidimicrobiales bacterium]
AALRLGQVRVVARTEVAASAVFLAIVALAAHPGHAAVAVALAFAAKSVLEILPFGAVVARTFADDGHEATPGWILGTQVVAFAIANLDYLVVALLLGDRALGLYGLAFRAASALPMQLNAVLVRLGTLDLAAADGVDRPDALGRLVRRLLLLGTAFGALGALLSPLVGPVLGDRWADAAPLMVPLFLATPWRLLLPLVGIHALVEGRARALFTVELVRLAVMAAALLAGASIGLQGVAVAGSLAMLVTTYGFFAWSSIRPSGAPHRFLAASALVGAAAISIGALL